MAVWNRRCAVAWVIGLVGCAGQPEPSTEALAAARAGLRKMYGVYDLTVRGIDPTGRGSKRRMARPTMHFGRLRVGERSTISLADGSPAKLTIAPPASDARLAHMERGRTKLTGQLQVGAGQPIEPVTVLLASGTDDHKISVQIRWGKDDASRLVKQAAGEGYRPREPRGGTLGWPSSWLPRSGTEELPRDQWKKKLEWVVNRLWSRGQWKCLDMKTGSVASGKPWNVTRGRGNTIAHVLWTPRGGRDLALLGGLAGGRLQLSQAPSGFSIFIQPATQPFRMTVIHRPRDLAQMSTPTKKSDEVRFAWFIFSNTTGAIGRLWSAKQEMNRMRETPFGQLLQEVVEREFLKAILGPK